MSSLTPFQQYSIEANMRSGNETIRPIKWEKNTSYWKMKLDSCSTSSKRRDKCRGRDLGKANHVTWPRSSEAIKYLLPYSWYHLKRHQRLLLAFPAESLGSANPPERFELVPPQNGRKENIWALRYPCVSPPAVSFKWWESKFFVLSLFDIFEGI